MSGSLKIAKSTAKSRIKMYKLLFLITIVPLLLVACGGGEQKPDPNAPDFAIAYIKRPIALDEQGDLVPEDVRRKLDFNAGGDLFVRDQASPSAAEKNVTFSFTNGMGDVKDVESDFDGTKFIFAMRAPEIEGADEDEQPTWNIWEYEIATSRLTRVISSDIRAEEGQDVAPHYLPDGRIIFSSTRQRQSGAILLDEGKPQFAALDQNEREPALVLHVMNADGSDIHQVSFNQNHDFDPSILNSGEVVFSRWDNMGGADGISLYKMRPDGMELQLYYGFHSHDTGTNGSTVQFLQPREMQDGRILAILLPFTGTNRGGDMVLIDAANYVDNNQPTDPSLGAVGTGQQSGTSTEVLTDGSISPGGRFRSAYPLWDGSNRALVSWSACRLIEPQPVPPPGQVVDPNAPEPEDVIIPCTEERLAPSTDPNAVPIQEAPPIYGIFIYDFTTQSQLPVVPPQEGFIFTDVVAAQDRPRPTNIGDSVSGVDVDSALVDEGVGILHIRSVYDLDGIFNDFGAQNPNVTDISGFADPAVTTADERPARFLRIVKAVSIPDDDILDIPGFAFGPNRALKMREIIGYQAIDPDGSVRLKVPANVAFSLSILDKEGRRIGPRHQSWIQIRPGEVLNCNGCHSHAGGEPPTPHGRLDAGAPSINAGAPANGVPFTNTTSGGLVNITDTMAEARTRGNDDALTPSVGLLYEDVWTDPNAAGRPADASFDINYDALDPASRPTNVGCANGWTNLCRIVINYEKSILPLWTLDRGANTCTNCHDTRDAADNQQVPAAQLDLGDRIESGVEGQLDSYRELLFGDTELELVGGQLQERLIDTGNVDANGDPIFASVPVAASMSAGGARVSYFMEKMNETELDAGRTLDAATVNHVGMLSPEELKLLSEWLDIGAQYYNNPFEVPMN